MPKPVGAQEQRAIQLVNDIYQGRLDYSKLGKDEQVLVYSWLVHNIKDPDQRTELDLPSVEDWEKRLGRVARRDQRAERGGPADSLAALASQQGGLLQPFLRGGAKGLTFGRWKPGDEPTTQAGRTAEFAGELASAIVPIGIAGKVGLGARLLRLIRAGRGGRAMAPALEFGLREAGTGALYGAGRAAAEAGEEQGQLIGMPSLGRAAKTIGTEAAMFAPFGIVAGRAAVGKTVNQILNELRTGQAVNVGGKQVLSSLRSLSEGVAGPGYPHALRDPATATKVLEMLETAKRVPRTIRLTPTVWSRDLPQELAGGKLGDLIRASREATPEAIAAAHAAAEGVAPAVQAATQAAVAQIAQAGGGKRPSKAHLQELSQKYFGRPAQIEGKPSKGLRAIQETAERIPAERRQAAQQARITRHLERSKAQTAVPKAAPEAPAKATAAQISDVELKKLVDQVMASLGVKPPQAPKAGRKAPTAPAAAPEAPVAAPEAPRAPAPQAPSIAPPERPPAVPRRAREIIGQLTSLGGVKYDVVGIGPNRYSILYKGKPASIAKAKVKEFRPKAGAATAPATQPGSTAPAEFPIPEGFKKLMKAEQEQLGAVRAAYPVANIIGNRIQVMGGPSASELKSKFPGMDWQEIEGGAQGILRRKYTGGAEKVRKQHAKSVVAENLRDRSAETREGRIWLAGDLVKILNIRTKQPQADEYQILGFFYPPSKGVQRALKARHGSAEFARVKNIRTGQIKGEPIYTLQHQGGGVASKPHKPATPPPTPPPTVGDI